MMKKTKDSIELGLAVLFILILVVSFVVFQSSNLSLVSDSGETYLSYDCGDTLTTYFSFAKQSCVEYGVEGGTCSPNEEKIGYDTQTSCSNAGGIWDECPQCPQGLICAKSVCEPSCSLPGTCALDVDASSCYEFKDFQKQPDKYSCYANNPTIPAESYERNNETYYRCSGEYVRDDTECVPEVPIIMCDKEVYDVYNPNTGACERTAEEGYYCSNGEKAEFDSDEGRYICTKEISKSRTCANNQLYDSVNKRCVDELDVYVPSTGEKKVVDQFDIQNELLYENTINTTAFYILVILLAIFFILGGVYLYVKR